MSALPVPDSSFDAQSLSRLLGRHKGRRPGPTVVCVAGVHGNEPSGVIALQSVFKRLAQLNPDFHGELIGLAGNMKALALQKRYLEKDLNRQWSEDHVEHIRQGRHPYPMEPEDEEQMELLDALHDAFDEAAGPVVLLDLHTTSAPGGPFVILGDSSRNLDFALAFHVPAVLGLETNLSGTLMAYVSRLGHCALGVEAGQHDDPRAIDVHVAVIWTALAHAGCLDSERVPERPLYDKILRTAGENMPRLLNVFYRHGVNPREQFDVRQGFNNVQPVMAGETVAYDGAGDITAPQDCYLIMPRYQSQGDDGFFLATPGD